VTNLLEQVRREREKAGDTERLYDLPRRRAIVLFDEIIEELYRLEDLEY
jgi:hypothetical protein